MPILTRQEQVYLLDLGDGENRFNEDWVASLQALLEEVAATPAPRALVTCARGKHWSGGLDLEWMAGQGDALGAFLTRVHELLAGVLESGVPCVAALQGHTYAAGAMLALAHDQRVMRADRGYFCLPEVDINIPFTPGMSALIAARLPKAVAHEAMTTGRRYGGQDAAAAGIVDVAVPEQDVLSEAIGRAAALADKSPETLSAIKRELYREPLAALRGPQGF